MLTREENEQYTRVGPGTPGGELLRRYWWPVGFSDEITARPKKIKALDEDIILFRDGSGRVGAVELRCVHRDASLEHGRVEANGIRCAYHGWLYDAAGRCLDQPCEPEDSTYKDRVRLRAYPTREAGGFVFAYLGPEPAPLLPRYDLLCREDGIRTLWGYVVHANWLQNAENAADQAHLFWLHGSQYPQWATKRPRLEFSRTEYGVRTEAYIPGVEAPKISCTIFPCHNRFTNARIQNSGSHLVRGPRHNILFRLPIDDHRTLWQFMLFNESVDGRLVQETQGIKEKTADAFDTAGDDGWWGIGSEDQDRVILESQGPIVNRAREHLATTDRGIILLREILRESLQAVQEGRDPFGVVRDPAANGIIHFDASMAELGALA